MVLSVCGVVSIWCCQYMVLSVCGGVGSQGCVNVGIF